jgi:hypothetical protein
MNQGDTPRAAHALLHDVDRAVVAHRDATATGEGATLAQHRRDSRSVLAITR